MLEFLWGGDEVEISLEEDSWQFVVEKLERLEQEREESRRMWREEEERIERQRAENERVFREKRAEKARLRPEEEAEQVRIAMADKEADDSSIEDFLKEIQESLCREVLVRDSAAGSNTDEIPRGVHIKSGARDVTSSKSRSRW